MSRMQNILEKAEREGAVMRVRSRPEPAGVVPAPATVDTGVAAMPVAGVTAAGLTGQVAPAVQSSPAIRLSRSLVAAAASESAAAEQYRALCTRIVHADQNATANVILVTSPGSGEGKSLTAANLALTMAREYQRPTCIIDANLRSPKLQELFGLPDGPGLSDVLAGRAPLHEALTMIETLGVTVLPAGPCPKHPAELLGTAMMRQTIDYLRMQFDRIVIDTSAALARADLGLLTPLADRIVLVVRAGVTAKSSIADVVTTLDATRLLGVVLNEAA
jgi:capsular exopolysaccharide synthesis family protein